MAISSGGIRYFVGQVEYELVLVFHICQLVAKVANSEAGPGPSSQESYPILHGIRFRRVYGRRLLGAVGHHAGTANVSFYALSTD